MCGETFHENKSKRESQLKRRSIALSVSHSQNSTNQVLFIASWARWQQMQASYWCEGDSYTHFTAPWHTLWWTKQSVDKVSSKAKATPSTEKSPSSFSFFLFLYENAIRLWWTSSHCSTGTNPISCRQARTRSLHSGCSGAAATCFGYNWNEAALLSQCYNWLKKWFWRQACKNEHTMKGSEFIFSCLCFYFPETWCRQRNELN